MSTSTEEQLEFHLSLLIKVLLLQWKHMQLIDSQDTATLMELQQKYEVLAASQCLRANTIRQSIRGKPESTSCQQIITLAKLTIDTFFRFIPCQENEGNTRGQAGDSELMCGRRCRRHRLAECIRCPQMYRDFIAVDAMGVQYVNPAHGLDMAIKSFIQALQHYVTRNDILVTSKELELLLDLKTQVSLPFYLYIY